MVTLVLAVIAVGAVAGWILGGVAERRRPDPPRVVSREEPRTVEELLQDPASRSVWDTIAAERKSFGHALGVFDEQEGS